MNSQTEQEKYLKAKFDLLQAEDSFLKLTPEQKKQLIIELFGYELLMELTEISEKMRLRKK